MIALSCASEAQSPLPAEPRDEEAPDVSDVPILRHAEDGAPASLAIDQPAVTMNVASPPGLELTIAEAGEYRVDVIAPEDVDPILFLYRGETLVARDDDGGDDDNARAVVFLEPGTYSVRIAERDGRAFDASVEAQKLEPMETDLTLALGPRQTPLTFPELPNLRRAENERDAARAVALTIPSAARYVCAVRMDNGRIARIRLVRDGRVVAEAAQRLTAYSAVIETELAPGTYELRMWDADHRGDMRALITCEARATE